MTTLTNNNDTYTAPLGDGYVDALAGTDKLIVNYATSSGPIHYWSVSGGGVYFNDEFNNFVFVNFESYDITGGAENDDLHGGDNADRLLGNGGNDLLSSGLGADTVDGGTGVDTWAVDYSSLGVNIAVTLLAGGVVSTVGATGAKLSNVEALSITTGVGNDTINGAAVVGNDTINTGLGNDSIQTGLGFDTVNAGDGVDVLTLNYSSQTTDIYRTDQGFGWLRYQNAYEPSTYVDYYSVERFNITGGSGHDKLYGSDLNDNLVGNAGNDRLVGYGGTDVINGGAGTDTWEFNYSSLLSNISINISSAAQTANTGATLTSIEQLSSTTGIGNDSFIANSGVFNDRFDTGDGNDTITTGRGKDWLQAGNGDSDTVIMNWSAVTQNIVWSDQGFGWYRFTSGTSDVLDYYGVERFTLTGGAGDDNLRGFAGTDNLTGGLGDDVLNSSTGKATINGGAGIDFWEADTSADTTALVINTTTGQTTAQGGAGYSILGIEGFRLTTGAGNDNINNGGYNTHDVVNTNNGNDSVNLGKGIDSTDGGVGTDTLVVDYSVFSSTVDRYDMGFGWFKYTDILDTASITFINYEKFNLTGGAAADKLYGGSNNDTLIGNAGNDLLTGSGGVDVINGGLGNDRWVADYSANTTALKLTLTAAGAGTLIGNGTSLTGIENISLTTGFGADIINTTALRGDNNINTGAGNDNVLLNGGHHVTNGGDNSDVLTLNFFSSTASVSLIDNGYGWNSFADSAGFNTAKFYGYEQFNLTTGVAADRLTTWGGDDIINSGGGNDVINAGGGNDLLTGGVGHDIFFYAGSGNGIDTITDAGIGDVLRINGSNFTGSTIVNGTGATVLTNEIQRTVNASNDITTLYIGTDGTAGADVVIQLKGSYTTGSFTLSGRDIILTAGAGDINTPTTGNDTVIGTSGNDTLTGGLGNDHIEGKAGNDELNGGDGADYLLGGLGQDVLTGGAGADKFAFSTDTDSTAGTFYHDQIMDFSAVQADKIDLSLIDANPALAGNQAFTFISTAFTGVEGQVRYDAALDLVLADIDGDSLVDIEIQMLGNPSINASNFIL